MGKQRFTPLEVIPQSEMPPNAFGRVLTGFKLRLALLQIILYTVICGAAGAEPKEASFYQKLDDNKVWCQLCFHKCIIAEAERGFCRVRENQGGGLYSLVYGKVASYQVMAVEKDTMYHFLPGARVFAIATASCNFRCKHCHNWTITQVGPQDLRSHHFNRFVPAYKLTKLPHTPIKTLEAAYKIARKTGLNYVNIGNVPGHRYNSTFCPKCEKRLIYRTHWAIIDNNIENGRCRFCQYEIAGVWW